MGGGQDEKVNWGLGIDVPDDDDLLVPVEHLGGDFTRDDFAEDAVHTGGCPGDEKAVSRETCK